MGYQTEFEGAFQVTPRMSDDEVDMYERNMYYEAAPSGYNQWAVFNDAHRLENSYLSWDGNEKFYNYVQHLEYVISHFFSHLGFKVNGTVLWRGEEMRDIGYIRVTDNHVETFPGQFPEEVTY